MTRGEIWTSDLAFPEVGQVWPVSSAETESIGVTMGSLYFCVVNITGGHNGPVSQCVICVVLFWSMCQRKIPPFSGMTTEKTCLFVQCGRHRQPPWLHHLPRWRSGEGEYPTDLLADW